MVKYIYKGKEIGRLGLISLMRSVGISSGYKVSHYEHLQNLASQGNTSAVEILNNLEVR